MAEPVAWLKAGPENSGMATSADPRSAGLTIIIVNWNGGEKLLRCLRSIRASRTSFPVKVIVVDNDSRDGSREQAASEFSEFQVINTGTNLGFGRGNNFARPWVDTPLVLFLNPDTELFNDTLEQAVHSLLSRPQVGMLGCQMLDPDGAVQALGLQWFPTPLRVLVEMLIPEAFRRSWLCRWLPVHDPKMSGVVHKLYGGFLLVRKPVLDAAGWFDERYFMYAEDVDLSRTIRDLGWQLYYDTDCAIVHTCGGSSEHAPSEFSILMKQHSVNQLIAKHQGPFAACWHRVVVGLAAGLRLVGLTLASTFNRVSGLRGRKLDNQRKFSWLLWQWARGQRAAPIPERPVSGDPSSLAKGIASTPTR